MVTASGIMSLPLANLKTMIANSSTFQTWTSTNVTTALGRIHLVQAASTAVLPCAVIGYSGGFGRDRTFSGVWENTGNQLEVQYKYGFASLSEEDAVYTYLNSVGPVMSDMEQLSEQAGFLNMTEWNVRWGPERPELDAEQTLAPYYAVMIDLAYKGV